VPESSSACGALAHSAAITSVCCASVGLVGVRVRIRVRVRVRVRVWVWVRVRVWARVRG
jgi:hypothetical protein